MTKSSWIILWTAFFAGVVATFVQFSIPPVLPLLQAQYHVSYANTALLMSLFALTTLLSAVPGGFIVRRYGVRTIGLFGLGILFAGVLCSCLAASFFTFLTSRIVQGIGFGLVSVAAPSAIGQFVAPRMMSVAMGIWSTWIPLGSLIMFLFAPYFVTRYHLGMYWIILMIILIMSIFIYAKYIPKTVPAPNKTVEPANLPIDDIRNELKNAKIWLAAGAFASFTFALFSFTTWISTYLVESSSMSLPSAAQIPSIVSFFMIGSNLYAGVFLKKLGNKRWIFLVPPFIMACIWPTFLANHIFLYISTIVLGLIGGFVPTIVFASAPLLAKRKETIGIAMSIVIIGENIGILLGPEAFGIVREYTGYFTASFWILSIVGLITVIVCLRLQRVWKVSINGEASIQEESF